MPVARTHSIALVGVEGHPVEVEADIQNGLPGLLLVGLPDTALREARDRIRAAVINSREQWPQRRITVGLSPASLPKRGSGFDVGIAVAILSAAGVVPAASIDGVAFLGELGLDGQLRPVRGVLPAVAAAAGRGFRRVAVPEANAAEAALVPGVRVASAATLRGLLGWLRGGPPGCPADQVELIDGGADPAPPARRRRHGRAGPPTWLMCLASRRPAGPPRSARPGATTSASSGRRGPARPCWPSASRRSCPAGRRGGAGGHRRPFGGRSAARPGSPLLTAPPFCAPHHTASKAAIVGGGSGVLRPGAASLAHRGCLFLDEAPEFGRDVLDALRQPLESGEVVVARGRGDGAASRPLHLWCWRPTRARARRVPAAGPRVSARPGYAAVTWPGCPARCSTGST